MKHKILLSIAAAAALSITSFGVTGADAASATTKHKVYTNQNKIIVVGGNFIKYPCPSKPNKPNQNIQKPGTNTDTSKPETNKPSVDENNNNQSTTSEISAYEQKVIDLTNAERKKKGLKPLQLDKELSKVARLKSEDMKAKNYFSHTSPTYGSPFDMMEKFGIKYKAAAENIAMGQRTPEEVVKGWMNSDGHRKNILSANYTHIGVGYVKSGNYWTQMFIGK